MDHAKAREWALVLDAEGIPYHLTPDAAGGWQLVVSPDDAARTVEALGAYETENFDPSAIATHAADDPRPGRRWPAWAVALGAVGGLAVLHAWSGPRAAGSAWFARGALDADAFGDGEVWRAVTALTLHADATHLAANALGGALLLAAVCLTLGPGAGLAAVVAAGTLGNAANAVLHGTAYSGVGASTAVFGALGVLAGAQFDRLRQGGRRRWPWLPVLAGVLLLALLGFGPETDVLAHVLGFGAGLGVGTAARRA
ncbi:hypothetical protein DCC79_14500, partial [bacterium]